MTLILRIENYDVLENGGPPWITIDEKNACVGRGSGMDWILPDPARHISSHHFDITFKAGKYYLTDVSTNGTFLQGQRYRLDGPHEIRTGDRFTVGHYIVGATLQEKQKAEPPRAQPPGHQSMIQQPPTWAPAGGQAGGGDDPWGNLGKSSVPGYVPQASPGHSSQPAPGQTPPPPPSSALRQPPISQPPRGPSPISSPPYSVPPGSNPPISHPPGSPGQAGSGQVHISQPPISRPPISSPPISSPPVHPQSQRPPQPDYTSYSAPPQSGHQYPAQPEAMPMPRPEATPVPLQAGPSPAAVPPPSPAAAPPGPASNEAVFRAFCEGAGLDPDAYNQADMVQLAGELGRCVRIATQEVMTMLQDRAAVKHFTRGGERTMRSATGNNPMKFMPDTEQALEAMFLKPRDGFMKGRDGFENALHDIRQHQGAVFAALQPALAQVLSGLSPDEITGEAGGGIMGGGKSRAWDAYVERWDHRANAGDNGMLDAFLDAFSKSYAEAVSRGNR